MGEGNDLVCGGNGDDIIYGEEGNDSLYGEYGNDTIVGGKGNDYLNGGEGVDTYIINAGDGNDTIDNYNYYDTWKSDKIKYGEGINPSDIQVFRREKNLVLKNKVTGDSVTVRNYYNDMVGRYSIGLIEFSDGTVWDKAYINEATRHYVGTDGNDTITSAGAGYNYNESETFHMSSGNDTVNAGGGNDLVYMGEGNDVVCGGNGDDIIYGEEGNDSLYGDYGNDTIVGGKGNDYLNGGEGVDTYIINAGDGNDTIDNYNYYDTWKSDKIKYGEGINPSDIQLYRSEKSLVLKNKVTGDSVTVRNYYNDTVGRYSIGLIEFSDGTVWDKTYINETARHYVGTSGNDTINGQHGGYNYNESETFHMGEGDDVVCGGNGDDIIYGEEWFYVKKKYKLNVNFLPQYLCYIYF